VALPAEDTFIFKETTYFILVVTPEDGRKSWQLTKRYNDFCSLCKGLGYPASKFPEAPFPRKHLTACEDVKLEKRRQKLEDWLNRTLKEQLKNPSWRVRLSTFLETGRHLPPTTAEPSVQTGESRTKAVSSSLPADFQKDPEGWFEYYDVHSNGLTKEEMILALCQSFHGCDVNLVRDFMSSLWTVFGVGKNGTLTLSEFMQKVGFREAVLLQMHAACPDRTFSGDRSAVPADDTLTLQIEIPPGVVAGQTLQVAIPGGREVAVIVPFGASAGTIFRYEFDQKAGKLTRVL